MTPDQIGFADLTVRKALYTVHALLLKEESLSSGQIIHLLDAQRCIAAGLKELEIFAEERGQNDGK